MILVDTSVWIDHLHSTEPVLVEALSSNRVMHHPMVAGEIALGNLRDRELVFELLTRLPLMTVAGHNEVMRFVENNMLYGKGLALVDAHLLASLRLTPDAQIWTRDKRMIQIAQDLGIATQIE